MHDQELTLGLPHRHISQIVLQDLKLSNHLAKCLPRLHVLQSVLDDAIKHAQTEGGVDQFLVVDRLGGLIPTIARFSEQKGIGHKDVIKMHAAGSDAPHPQLRHLGNGDALTGRGDQKY